MIDGTGLIAVIGAASTLLGVVSTMIYSYFSGRENLQRLVDERVKYIIETLAEENEGLKGALADRNKRIEELEERLDRTMDRVKHLEDQIASRTS